MGGCESAWGWHSWSTRGKDEEMGLRGDSGQYVSCIRCLSGWKVQEVNADRALWGKADHRWLVLVEIEGPCFGLTLRVMTIITFLKWDAIFALKCVFQNSKSIWSNDVKIPHDHCCCSMSPQLLLKEKVSVAGEWLALPKAWDKSVSENPSHQRESQTDATSLAVWEHFWLNVRL